MSWTECSCITFFIPAPLNCEALSVRRLMFVDRLQSVTYTVSYDDYALIYDQYYDPDLYDAVCVMHGTFPTLIMYRTSYLSTSSSTRVHYYSSLF